MKSNVQLHSWLTTPMDEVASQTPVADDQRAASLTEGLNKRGVRAVRGTYVDSSGVLRAKQVPVERLGAFNRSGLGASNSWAVFGADDLLCMTPRFSAVGDMRLRADLDVVVDLGDGVAWTPLSLVDQEGVPLEYCPRAVLRRQIHESSVAGLSIVAATEVEFTMYDAERKPLGGAAYGWTRLSSYEQFVDSLSRALDFVGVPLEQIHAEYGPGQFELSVAPVTPLAAADLNVLVRVMISRVARACGFQASFSPKPFADAIGNGAHSHLSFHREGRPLLSGGDGPHGLTREGESILAAYVRYLPEMAGVLASSVLSSMRLQPSTWSGAYACWGLENREAAVRLCAATPGNPYGANVEVKCVDPAANIYAAYAALVGVARRSLEVSEELGPETTVDPANLSAEERDARGIHLVGAQHTEVLERFAGSQAMREVLGEALVETILAVRRHEADLVEANGIAAVAEQLAFAWSA
ncbi:MAG: glutamine synthetase [Acidobacteriota bacterium]|nr:glutamine synthetase [Acidobacteriota bacterium]MDE3082623.1 glutamine synthetase [Acidobacteriota bacterium]